ncbi:MAG TPA: DUF6788 family protein [Pyrinomonadaceae bacterium]|jgi:hypothetical protein|nr:DUF6788 family protein [Pyrinomonadaceae bacterium]
MGEKRLQAQSAKAKDVTPHENGSRGGESKKSADSLPKILRLAARGGSLQAQRVKCGKSNCRCARGQSHEGYYYLFLSSPAGLSKLYVRRKDVPAVIAERQRRRRAWRAELDEARAFLRRIMSDAVGV